jgi:NADP-dependent 3-hydroxy acid dehydrogenase YdfG
MVLSGMADPFAGWMLQAGAGQNDPMTSNSELKGTVALVTGASSGIGEATALTLARAGADVAIVARRQDRLDALAFRLRDEGAHPLVIPADITSRKEAHAAVAQTVSELGRLDTLVNNAGVMLLGPAVDAPLGEWERMIKINLEGMLYCAHAAMPHLLVAAQDGARKIADMVNISSVAGRVARNGSAVYNLTKHGVGAFSEALRQEVTGRHVRISLVEPGATATELRSHNRPVIQEQIAKRFGEIEILKPQDIADAIAYIVTRPWHIAINEILIRPTEQEG